MEAGAARIFTHAHARNFKRGRRRSAASSCSGAAQAGFQRTGGTAGVLAHHAVRRGAQPTMFGPGSMKLAICMSSADMSPSSGSTTALRRSNRATSAPMAPKARERQSAMSSLGSTSAQPFPRCLFTSCPDEPISRELVQKFVFEKDLQ